MTKIELILDDDDARAVNDAIEERSKMGIMPPDDGSNAAGACVAEICRGWGEMLAMAPEPDDLDPLL